MTDASGRLVFREGALLTALRRGQWLVLDELNLAPSEVLEALNRCAAVFLVMAAVCQLAVHIHGQPKRWRCSASSGWHMCAKLGS